MYWLGAVIAISLLIVVHEAGHFVVAKLCKMRVDRFSLGFGPAILGWKRNGTLFQLAPIPFGGFVEIRGMNVAEDVDRDDPHAYPNRPVWQRFLTIFAGPATNYLFAILLAFGLFTCEGVEADTAHYTVTSVSAGAPAAGKLEPGDTIIGFNGESAALVEDGVAAEVSVLERIARSGGEPIVLTVLRQGRPVDVELVPARTKELADMLVACDAIDKQRGLPRTQSLCGLFRGNVPVRIGVALDFDFERLDVGLFGALGHALWYPVEQTKVILGGLYKIVIGEEKGEFKGPVGIADVVQQAISFGWVTAIGLLMVLNVYLGMFNLFPLPALDGGRLVFLTYEMATRRRANPKIEATVHMAGIMVLLVLMVVVTFNDCRAVFS